MQLVIYFIYGVAILLFVKFLKEVISSRLFHENELVNKAYECGRTAEGFRRWNSELGFLNASIHDEEGIKYLEEAINISKFQKNKIKKILIRVCIGLAEDYLQYDDFPHANVISEKIIKYRKDLHDDIINKPTLSGGTVSEQLSPLIKELANYYREKMPILQNEQDRNEAIEISNKLILLMT